MQTPEGGFIHISLPAGLSLVGIGWIDGSKFTTGVVPDDRIEAIREIVRQNPISDGHLGVHSCAMCGKTSHGKISAHGNYLFRIDSDVIMFPRFIIHYIVSHSYCPPERLFEAIYSGRQMTLDDFELTSVEEALREFNAEMETKR